MARRLPGGRADALGLAPGGARGGRVARPAAPRRPGAGRRRAGGAGRAGGGAERRDARRVRRAAGRACGRAAQPLGPVPGAQGLGLVRKKRRPRPPTGPRGCGRGADRVARRAGRGRPRPPRVVDETGIDPRTTRAYARAARGRRAIGRVPRAVGAADRDRRARADGVVASRSVAARPARRLPRLHREVLVPALRGRPDALVVLDNLAAHKAEKVREALDRAGLAHRYLPSYSPDLNPIEPAWSKLEAGLRAVGARSRRPRRPPSARRSPRSPPRTPGAGSASPATPAAARAASRSSGGGGEEGGDAARSGPSPTSSRRR